MTGWNKYNNPLAINSYYDVINDQFLNFLETLSKNMDDEPFWKIDDGEIKPISYTYVRPLEYIQGYLAIVQWLKDQSLNIESGYAFVYQNEEDGNDRSVGGINSNNEGITICELNGKGIIINKFYKI